MKPGPTRPAPARTIITVLLGLFAVVLVVQLIFGLPQFVFYGFIGGLVFCLVIVGRDRLLAAQRMIEPPPAQEPQSDDNERR
jgi:hypothetical protein